MAVVHDAELMTVGPDEAVVTFRTTGDEPVTTRVGDAEVTTRGPYHSARVAGLEAATEYELDVDGAERSEWLPPTFTSPSDRPGRSALRTYSPSVSTKSMSGIQRRTALPLAGVEVSNRLLKSRFISL